MAKIKSIEINYPNTKEGMEKIQQEYTKTLAEILVKNYPENIIRGIIKKLKNDKHK